MRCALRLPALAIAHTPDQHDALRVRLLGKHAVLLAQPDQVSDRLGSVESQLLGDVFAPAELGVPAVVHQHHDEMDEPHGIGHASDRPSPLVTPAHGQPRSAVSVVGPVGMIVGVWSLVGVMVRAMIGGPFGENRSD
jgi:hypothetical protein